MRRLYSRGLTEHLAKRHYEGASVSRRTANWKSPASGPNAALAGSLSRLRNRARDLGRNNPWASKAVRTIRNNVAGGSGIQLAPEGEAAAVDRARKAWADWAGTTECDAAGKLDMGGLYRLAIRTIAESGEVLIRRRRRRSRDGLTVPMQIQLLEPDHIDVSRDLIDNRGNRIIQGVQYNAFGRIEGYWLFPEHPGEVLRSSKGYTSEFVPADDVLLAFEIQRPGQVRGVPLGCTTLILLRDYDEYSDATLVKQKVAALFAGFLEDNDFAEMVGDVASAAPDADIETMEPGTIQYNPIGKKMTFSNPPENRDFEPFSRRVLQAIASGYGISYESLTGDLSNVSFISGRFGMRREHENTTTWQGDVMLPQVCNPIYAWFRDAAEMAGHGIADTRASWTTPKAAMVDPGAEAKSARERIRSGLTTHSEVLREEGWDPVQARAEMQKDFEELDKMGLILDCDPRRTSGQGQLQVEPAAPNADPNQDPAADGTTPGTPADEATPATEETPKKKAAKKPAKRSSSSRGRASRS